MAKKADEEDEAGRCRRQRYYGGSWKTSRTRGEDYMVVHSISNQPGPSRNHLILDFSDFDLNLFTLFQSCRCNIWRFNVKSGTFHSE